MMYADLAKIMMLFVGLSCFCCSCDVNKYQCCISFPVHSVTLGSPFTMTSALRLRTVNSDLGRTSGHRETLLTEKTITI